jgi:tetratricopeptide (TPR) repeat protein
VRFGNRADGDFTAVDFTAVGFFAAALAILLLTLAGCSSSADESETGAGPGSAQMVDDLFANAVGLLNDLDEFDPSEALPQVINRLNQWIGTRKPIAHWQPDPLVGKLEPRLKKLPPLVDLSLLRFEREDGLGLQEAVWLREAARTIVGRETDDLARARRLFDWTVRNIELLPEDAEQQASRWPQRPWETMLLGRGQVVDRAWVWILLARQQGLDVVLLAADTPEARHGRLPEKWLPALLLEKSLYLFDPQWGLPIPGADGRGVATLEQAASDPRIFERLDSGAKHHYRLRADDLRRVVVLVEGSSYYLSQRMELLELHLAGADRIVLSLDASGLVDRAAALGHVGSGRLWNLPYERLAEKFAASKQQIDDGNRQVSVFRSPTRNLWSARVLHLMGRYTGPRGAIHFYQLCRPANDDIADALEAGKVTRQIADLARQAKEDASYWLGLLAYERGLYETAIDYFRLRTLDSFPKGAWTEGAHYNLARSYEDLGQAAEAIAQYDATQSAQRPGNLVRAGRLKAEMPQKNAE